MKRIALNVFCAALAVGGCSGKDGPLTDSSSPYGEVWTEQAFTCSCTCGGDGESHDIDTNGVCLPEGWTPEDYCEERVCPFIEIALNDILVFGCEVECEPALVNNQGTVTSGGVTRLHAAPDCDQGCDEVLCDLSYGFSGISGNPEECTYSTNSCDPDGNQSYKICREITSGEGDSEETAVDTGGREAESVDSDLIPVITAPFPYSPMTTPACVDGRGLFVLFPIRVLDRNTDKKPIGVMRGFQMSGTGHLTDDAWITQLGIKSPLPTSNNLLAIKPNEVARVNSQDQLANAEEIAVNILPTEMRFPLGVLGGGTPFITTNLKPTIVDIGWSCVLPQISGPLRNDTHIPAFKVFDPTDTSYDYHVKLSDVGCGVDWPQLLTLKPHELNTRPKLTVELFGSPGARRTVSLVPIEGGLGYSFSFELLGLSMEGQLFGVNDYTALLKLTSTNYKDMSPCVPGIYPLTAN